jgi:hypothetical protein
MLGFAAQRLRFTRNRANKTHPNQKCFGWRRTFEK